VRGSEVTTVTSDRGERGTDKAASLLRRGHRPGRPFGREKRKPYCQDSGSELILILLAERRYSLLQIIKNFEKAQHTHQL
jgi:hypothetical protein